MSHLKEADRKKIYSMLAHGNKCCEIAEAVGCDPTAIAKEIKRNRIVSKDASNGQKQDSMQKARQMALRMRHLQAQVHGLLLPAAEI